MGKKSKLNVSVKKERKDVVVQPVKVKPNEPEPESEPESEHSPQAEGNSLEVFLWLLAYSALMFSLPFLGFYGVRSWLEESYPQLSTFEINCYSVLTAVLVVNLIVAMYVVKAFREKEPGSGEHRLAVADGQKKDQ
ncbi:uncharacterized protein LOC115620351 [Scaptodrosophila lebanonensis]|uniref:Uncharacterized protein LOC115620351 n=1 Tax=Drosophila lebanonensis TaxID=7225 RepID=A0A6J2T3F0_DROLE|nr:uncharacterized protein LOC115620351 [Scaptodrosophila lebanonensis]